MSGLNREVEAGICFLHAPLFHPALKTGGADPQEPGHAYATNMLGPMVNPAKPGYQLVGVYSLEMARLYNYLLQPSGKSFTIIHGLDGYDEISLTNDTKGDQTKERVMTPEQLENGWWMRADISGGYSGRSIPYLCRHFARRWHLGTNAVVLAMQRWPLHYPENSRHMRKHMGQCKSLDSSGAANQVCLEIVITSINGKISISMHILDEIVANKRLEVAARKAGVEGLTGWKGNAFWHEPGSGHWLQNLTRFGSTGIIAEFKRKSPSRRVGLAGQSVEPEAGAYNVNGAAGISVLTDTPLFFGGNLEDLMRAKPPMFPVLRKDFMIDPGRLPGRKAFGADHPADRAGSVEKCGG